MKISVESRFLKVCGVVMTAAVMMYGQAYGQSSDAPLVLKYKFFDVGTLGGNFSGFFEADSTYDDFTPRPLNARGQLAGTSIYPNDTTAAPFVWTKGKLTVLPTLPKGNQFGGGSNANGLNDAGLVVGASSYGLVDPANNQLYFHAVQWTNGSVYDLGDFGGHDSWANYVNDAGLVVGYAYNKISDPYSYYGTQYHAATWRKGQIQDLGTLGGTDSEGWAANDAGDIIGIAFVNDTPIPPYNVPQEDAFVWSNGVMQDLGNLGGAFSTPAAINLARQVDVISLDGTNQYVQSYLWTQGTKAILASFGGNFNEALALNDLGASTGAATDATDTNLLAAVWDSNGAVRSIGTITGDTGSIGFGINNHGVIVGGSGTVTVTSASSYAHAFVWQGGVLRDLNTLIPASSGLTLNVAYAVNEEGVIAGSGTTSSGDTHAFVLVPDSEYSGELFPTEASAPAAPGSAVHGTSPIERFSRH